MFFCLFGKFVCFKMHFMKKDLFTAMTLQVHICVTIFLFSSFQMSSHYCILVVSQFKRGKESCFAFIRACSEIGKVPSFTVSGC